MTTASGANKAGIVIIGRNEGQRLISCLKSISGLNIDFKHVVYVDSGSNDGSQSAAENFGAICLNLDMTCPFSAARARNEGWRYLTEHYSIIEFIQFIDGDCLLQSEWLQQALQHLIKTPRTAVVCGRRREIYPEKSIYNQFCDDEWSTPIGPTLACGGDALMRVKALQDVDGYTNYFVAGEEPEMCYRMRQRNWQIFRLDAEMTLHDANITHFKQWWKRANRAGFAFALSAKEHGKGNEKFGVRQASSSLAWSGLLIGVLLLSLFSPAMLFAVLIFPFQIIRLFLRQQYKSFYGFKSCFFLMISKLPEALGVMELIVKTIKKQDYTIIEYK
ncbi:MAG: glycosyltransferase involved in cell wall biosynthesis [Alphaproteobacteria bacterium]|jgi:glycosyltransferase involved in cell wall biosynthesis